MTVNVTRLDVRAPGFMPESFPIEPTGEDLDVGVITVQPRLFGGIGLGLRVEEGQVGVMGVYDGTPAARAGLSRGDSILEIDGERVDGLALEEVVGRIRGTEGSDVSLLVRRPGEPEPFVVELTREVIDHQRLEREQRRRE